MGPTSGTCGYIENSVGRPDWRLSHRGSARTRQPNRPEKHYFYQSGWAARHVGRRGSSTHVDVGGRWVFLPPLTGFVPVVGIELRIVGDNHSRNPQGMTGCFLRASYCAPLVTRADV
jgi:hypothetical protein